MLKEANLCYREINSLYSLLNIRYTLTDSVINKCSDFRFGLETLLLSQLECISFSFIVRRAMGSCIWMHLHLFNSRQHYQFSVFGLPVKFICNLIFSYAFPSQFNAIYGVLS